MSSSISLFFLLLYSFSIISLSRFLLLISDFPVNITILLILFSFFFLLCFFISLFSHESLFQNLYLWFRLLNSILERQELASQIERLQKKKADKGELKQFSAQFSELASFHDGDGCSFRCRFFFFRERERFHLLLIHGCVDTAQLDYESSFNLNYSGYSSFIYLLSLLDTASSGRFKCLLCGRSSPQLVDERMGSPPTFGRFPPSPLVMGAYVKYDSFSLFFFFIVLVVGGWRKGRAVGEKSSICVRAHVLRQIFGFRASNSTRDGGLTNATSSAKSSIFSKR